MSWTEKVAPDEEARFNAYAAEFRAMQAARAKAKGTASRALHTKRHLGAVGQLTVGNLPDQLRVGPFAAPATWPIYARFSNGSAGRQHDGIGDVRGLALKLVGVPGKKLIPGLEEKKTQDFLFIQSPATPFRTPDEFVTGVRIVGKGKALLLPRFLGAFGLSRTLSIVRGFATLPKVSSMATARFFTATPIRFGASAAKLSLVPAASDARRGAGGRDALREDLVARLKSGPILYNLRVQLFVDEKTTPIEDASVVWPEERSPFQELASVRIIQQDPLSPRGEEIDALVEKISFDPWHSLPELRPLGAMMRARAAAYRESVIGRGAADEPESVLDPA